MDRIVLNVGGKIFHTTRSTLSVDPNSMLAKMFDPALPITSAKDEDGAWFIDRDPKYFRAILNFLRDPSKLVIDPGISREGLLQEADFYMLQPLIDQIKQINHTDLTRHDIFIHGTQITFYGAQLVGLDLSDLNFNDKSFENADISRVNFEGCRFENTDFTKAHGAGANFSKCTANAAKFTHAQIPDSNFDLANLTICNFNHSDLKNSSFRGANCSSALFQKNDLSDAVFTNAQLSRAKFQHSKLANADFTGANLENSHFSSSDLRGAKNINWASYHKVVVFTGATITQGEYDAIPLSVEEKQALGLVVV